MKSLSQSEYGELRSLYQQVYASPEVEITEELIDEIFDELLDELVEEGYEQEEAIEILDEAIDDYLAEGYYDSAVSCLLYTSPSPRDKRQSRMPSSA